MMNSRRIRGEKEGMNIFTNLIINKFFHMGSKNRTYMNLLRSVLSGPCLPISAYPFKYNNYIYYIYINYIYIIIYIYLHIIDSIISYVPPYYSLYVYIFTNY